MEGQKTKTELIRLANEALKRWACNVVGDPLRSGLPKDVRAAALAVDEPDEIQDEYTTGAVEAEITRDCLLVDRVIHRLSKRGCWPTHLRDLLIHRYYEGQSVETFPLPDALPDGLKRLGYDQEYLKAHAVERVRLAVVREIGKRGPGVGGGELGK